MVIQRQNSKKIKELNPGDTFVFCDSYYMVTNCTNEDSCDTVNLETGKISWFEVDSVVCPIKIVGIIA